MSGKRTVMEETTQAPHDWLDMAAWVGRQQAFAIIADNAPPLKRCPSSQ